MNLNNLITSPMTFCFIELFSCLVVVGGGDGDG
jgi:hypothetical protein